MSISSITYDGFGRTLNYHEMETIVEDAIHCPSTVLVPKDASGIRSLDKVASFGPQNILILPIKFFSNVGKLINAYRIGDKQQITEGWIRVSTLPFGLGGAITEGFKTAMTINMITNIALLVLTPIHEIFAAFYFLGQLVYELVQGAQADEYVQLTKIMALDALGKTGSTSSCEEREEALSILKGNKRVLIERVGSGGTELLFSLLEKRFSPINRESGFSHLESIVGRKMAEMIFQMTDKDKPVIEEEDLFRIIEGRFIESTLNIFQTKSMGLSKQQKGYAREFFKKNIQKLPAGKAMEYTFGSINTTVKRNFKNFTRIARPWMAIKFVREFHPTNDLLKTANISQKNLGIAKGRELIDGIFHQAQKTELVHSIAIFGILMMIALLAITHAAPVGIIILGIVLEFLYYIVRNTLAYGYLDAKGETFEIKHCIPTIFKEIYTWYQGKSEPLKLEECSPQDFMTRRAQAMKVSSYSRRMIHWMFA